MTLSFNIQIRTLLREKECAIKYYTLAAGINWILLAREECMIISTILREAGLNATFKILLVYTYTRTNKSPGLNDWCEGEVGVTGHPVPLRHLLPNGNQFT